ARPHVVEVLHGTVRVTERHHRLELLRDSGLDRVGKQLDRVAGEEGWVFDHPRAGHHHIADTEVDLYSKTYFVHTRVHQNARSFAFRILGDPFGHHAIGKEGETVRLHIERRTVLDESGQARLIRFSLAQHVDVH